MYKACSATPLNHSTVKQNRQMPACSTCTSTYSSRLDSRQAEGSREEIEGRGVKDRAQMQAVSASPAPWGRQKPQSRVLTF